MLVCVELFDIAFLVLFFLIIIGMLQAQLNRSLVDAMELRTILYRAMVGLNQSESLSK